MSQFSDDSHIRFWAMVTVAAGVPTLQANFNVASITDTGQGLLTLTFTRAFANAFWCCNVVVERASTALTVANLRYAGVRFGGIATTTALVECWDGTATTALQSDPNSWHVSGKGVQ